MIAGGGDSEVDQRNSLARNRSRNEYDTGSVEADNLQSTDQTEPIASTYGSARLTSQSLGLPSRSSS
jgi:hypothetical protein